MITLGNITKYSQTLYAFEFDGEKYYLLFHQRGYKLECSDVYKFEIKEDVRYIEPHFRWMRRTAQIQKVVKAAREQFTKDFS